MMNQSSKYCNFGKFLYSSLYGYYALIFVFVIQDVTYQNYYWKTLSQMNSIRLNYS